MGALAFTIEILFPVVFPLGSLIHIVFIVASLHLIFNSQKPSLRRRNGAATPRGHFDSIHLNISTSKVVPSLFYRSENFAEICEMEDNDSTLYM